MSLFLNATQSIYGGVKNCLNCVQNFGSQIIHSKTVQSHVEKASFVSGYTLMRMSQCLFSKEQLPMPKVVQQNVLNGTSENLDWFVGLGSAATTDQILDVILNLVEPIQRRFLTEDHVGEEELISKYGFPPQILENRFTDFRNFVLESKIYIPMHDFGHTIIYDDRRGDFLVKLDNTLIPSTIILQNFRLEDRAVSERMFLPAFIIEKKSGNKYSYLHRGLTQHDVEQDIRPYKILPVDERPEKPILKFNFCIDSKLETPEDAANYFYHAWCELVQTNGECYSFGLFGKGVVQCPDPSSFRRADIRSIAFEMTEIQAMAIFDKVQRLREEMKWNYHLVKNNCSTFVKQIASVIGIDISERGKLKELDSPITRIKMYAVSSILAHLLRNPEIVSKIGVIHELANIKMHVDNLPVTIKELIAKFSIQEGLEASEEGLEANFATDLFDENNPSIKSTLLKAFAMLHKIVTEFNANRISDALKATNPIPPEEIKELCRSLLTASEKELTYKIYNLFDSVFTNYYDYELDSPGFVYENLKKIQAQKFGHCITII